MKIEKDIFKTSMDITTFLHYCEKEKIVEKDAINSLKEYLTKYITQKELNRKVMKESIK